MRWILARNASVLVGLPFLVMACLGYFWLYPQVRHDSDRYHRQLAVAVAAQTESYLANSRNSILILAASLSGEAAGSPGEVQRMLDSAPLQLGELQTCYLVGKDGRIEAISSSGTGNRSQELVGMDLSGNQIVRSVLATGRERWSDSYLSIVKGGISVCFAVPVRQRALICEMELRNLSGYLSKLSSATSNQKILVLDGRGQVIADREGVYTAQQLNLSNIPLVGQGAGRLGLTTGDFAFEGKQMMGALYRIPETEWSVLVAETREDANRQLLTSWSIVKTGLGAAMLLSLVIGLYFARSLVRRLEHLALHARSVAAGSAGLDWPTSEIAEFNLLSQDLERMAGSLQERAVLLEEQVRERESAEEELRVKNEELAAAEEELRQQLDELFHIKDELERREEEYKTVADWTYDWEYWITPEGAFRYVSPACERVTGYAAGDFLSDAGLLLRLVHPEDRQAFALHLEESALPGPDDDPFLNAFVFRLWARDGGQRWIEHSCRPVFSGQGVYLGRRACNRDITDRRVLEQQVLQQQKMEGIGLLAGGIAHDFNNLLLPILIGAEMIQTECQAEAPATAKRATMILTAGHKAKDLVKQLLTFSHKQDLQFKPHDLNEIVSGFTTMLSRTIRENITLVHRLSPVPCSIMADRIQIEQILLNLVVNATDAMEGNGCITLETGHLVFDAEYCRLHPGTQPGRYALLSFSDTGCGMDDATLAHIFEPFYTTKPTGKGTGLGLSTSYGIIKQHGGSVEVYSKPGSGTTFRVYLPEAAPDHSTLQDPAATAPCARAAGATILLVEDNAMVLEMVREVLDNQGYTVFAAARPDEARELIHDSEPVIDLLISDVVMPHMSGPELYDSLLELYPGLRALFISGYADSSVVHKGQLHEGVNFVAKPFTAEAILKKVQEVMRGGVGGAGAQP